MTDDPPSGGTSDAAADEAATPGAPASAGPSAELARWAREQGATPTVAAPEAAPAPVAAAPVAPAAPPPPAPPVAPPVPAAAPPPPAAPVTAPAPPTSAGPVAAAPIAPTEVRIEPVVATPPPEPSPFAVLALEQLREAEPAAPAPPAGAVGGLAAPPSPAAPPADVPAAPAPAATAPTVDAPAAPVAPAAPQPTAVAASSVAAPPGAGGSTPSGPARRGPVARGWAPTTPGAFWRWGFPVLVVVLAVLVPVLVKVGKDTVLQSTDGRLLNTVTDPAAPGFQVITEPTPTLLLVQTDEAGVANGLTVLSLTGDTAGGMVFVPMTTVLELPGIGNIPLDAAAARAGVPGLQAAVEGVLGVGMGEVAVVDPQGWADLVAPLGSIEIDNPDDVKVAGPNGEKVVVYPKGPLTLQPQDVAPYLSALSPGENDLNRLVRHQAFWDAWLRKVGTSDDPAVVPGESKTGVGRFVRALAAGQADMAPLPVQTASIPGSDLAVYVPVADQVKALVARFVPFPVGAPPGARPRVRLLDGTGDLDHGVGAVALVVAAGGQVDQIGNADAFGVPVTTITYSDDAKLPDAQRVQAALGVGEVRKVDSAQTAIDVTVVLGADYAAQPPPSLAPVTTAPR